MPVLHRTDAIRMRLLLCQRFPIACFKTSHVQLPKNDSDRIEDHLEAADIDGKVPKAPKLARTLLIPAVRI